MRRGSNLGWIVLITAPFALAIKSLSMFSKAIMTLFKPSPRRARVRPRNYQVEDDVKRSKIALNKAKQGKIRAEIRLIRAKEQAMLNSSGVVANTLTAMGVNAKDYMGCAECNWIDSTGKDVKCPKCGKPLRAINW